MIEHVRTSPLSVKRFVKNALRRTMLALGMNAFLLSPTLAEGANKGPADVRDCEIEESLRFRGGTLRVENDLFTGTDQNYTNGVALTLISHDIPGRLRLECIPAPVRLHAQLIQFVNPGFWADTTNSAATQNAVVRFGQSMYTPGDYTRADLIHDDRPYAGLLYMGFAWNRRKREPEPNREVLDTREVTLGVIGPLSLAEQSQNIVHDVRRIDRFDGWQHQLKNEPAFQFALDRKFREFRGTGATIPGFSADSIRSLGLRLGNIETSATFGVEGRMGWNLPNDFGSYPLRPGAENRPPSAASIRSKSNFPVPVSNRPRPGVHLFGILEAKAVAYDFSLDGNLFRSSHGVSRRPWVAQAAVGVSAQGILEGHGVRLAVMHVYRSREFEEQSTNQSYGSVALSFEF
ncbi:Type I secretion system, outer membrane component LapE [Thauera chlorobenzoica]|uniref:Type I secretion system, outer membrane component LapE n=2 Tax=Thauera chlorobenzoica TaxID=96773 RepID=A0A1L6FB63_9RHOO|nr:Type I secretion system, outer membrane component LapE [Thauera chlorobenzoica]